jgi:signal transduction histidine kinase
VLPTEHLAALGRSATFRLGLRMAGTFCVTALLLLAFIYWQTAVYETARIDAFLAAEAVEVAQEDPLRILRELHRRIAVDLHRVNVLALFDPAGRPVEGNLTVFPVGLPIDGAAHPAEAIVSGDPGGAQSVRAVARRLPGGDVLVIGRTVYELVQLRSTVLRALELGLLPVAALSVAAATLLSLRVQDHIKRVNAAIGRIMQGDLRGRIPVRGGGDDIDRLTESVNGMLDEIERLVAELRAVGDNIAHDLRTPLARLRARLERALAGTADGVALRAVIARAILDLDQTQAIITALLRIAEIEAGQRRAAFGPVDLAAVCAEVHELYAPVAELKRQQFLILAPAPVPAYGDADLLTEAIANLVDNATKFTPDGGSVQLIAEHGSDGPCIRVRDDGPGIPPAEREAVLTRFHRADRSRHVPGNGLGLSLVAAIARLHHFAFHLHDAGPGCEFTLVCAASPFVAAAGPGH